MARPAEVARLRRRIDCAADAPRAVGGGDPGLAGLVQVDRHGERGLGRRVGRQVGQVERVEAGALHRQAQQAPAVSDHDVDRGGGYLLRGHDEVAFVLAVRIVDHDDDHAPADRVDGT
jgi:hypothetical protein